MIRLFLGKPLIDVREGLHGWPWSLSFVVDCAAFLECLSGVSSKMTELCGVSQIDTVYCSLLLAPCSLFLNILLLSKTPQLELDSRAAPACFLIIFLF